MNDVIKFSEVCKGCGGRDQVFDRQCDPCFNGDLRWRVSRGWREARAAGLVGVVGEHPWAASLESAALALGDAEGLTRLKFTLPGVEDQTVERYVRGEEAAHALGVHMLNGGFGIDYGSFRDALGFDGVGDVLEESAQHILEKASPFGL